MELLIFLYCLLYVWYEKEAGDIFFPSVNLKRDEYDYFLVRVRTGMSHPSSTSTKKGTNIAFEQHFVPVTAARYK